MSSSPTRKTTKNGALRFTVSYVASSLIFSFRLLWLTVGRVLTNTKSIPSLPDTHSTVSGGTSKCPWTSCWTLKCSRRLLHGCGRVSEYRKNMGHFGYLYCCDWAGRLLAWQLCHHCLSVCKWANVFWVVGGLQRCEINIIPFTKFTRNYLGAVCLRKHLREHLENCIDYQLT